MISVKPGSDGHRVLAALVRCPGSTSEQIAADLYGPPPPMTAEQVRSPDRLRILREREGQRRAHQESVQRILGRLQERGLVERQGAARVSPAWTAALQQRSPEAALRLFSDWRILERRATPYLRFLERVAADPRIVSDLSTYETELYRRLIEWDVLVAPRQRWPTAAGISLVEESAP